jgi:TP901 family phage tail tape measure protein
MSFGASNMSIGISIFLRDQFSGPAAGVKGAMRSMTNQARMMQEQQLRMTRNLNAAGAAIGVGALNQMSKWIKTGSEFGYTMQYVSSIAEQTGVSYDKLSGKAKLLGQNTMFTATDVASGMRFMAMAGQGTAEIFNNITAAVNLAGATMTELGGKGGTADILTNVMKGFNIESTLENSTRVTDVLATATTSANMSLFDLGEALKYSTSTARDLNISLEETTSMIGMLGDAGIQASMGGTAVENMLRYLTKAAGRFGTKKQAEALGMLGLSGADLQDAEGNLLPISQVLRKMSASIGSMGSIAKQDALSQVFGVRGKRAGSVLLRDMDSYDKFLDKLINKSSGKAASVMSQMMGTLEGNILQMSSAWGVAKIAFTDALEPVLIPLLKVLTTILKAITGIMSTKFGAFLTIIGVGFLTVKTAAMAYRAVQAGIKLMNMQMASTFASTAASTVAGYRSMTAAATTYKYAALSSGGMRTMGGVTATGAMYGAKYRGPKGFMSTSQANRAMYGPGFGVRAAGPGFGGLKKSGGLMGGIKSKLGGLGKVGKMGSMFKGGGLGFGIAGMGLGYLGEKMGGYDTTAGGVTNVAGSVASSAGMGAMLGSIIPGLGTAVGGLAGAVWGLGSGIYDWITASEDNTDAIEEQTSALDTKAALIAQDPASFWRNRLEMVNSAPYRSITTGGFRPDEDWSNGRFRGSNGQAFNGDPTGRMGQNNTQTNININVDGESKINEIIESTDRTAMYEIGM